MIRAFILGMVEFRSSVTSRCEHADAYDAGRDFAHRLTFRRYDQ